MRETASHEQPVIRRIFFPSDLSPESERAFGHARLLAARLGAAVTIYHALEIPPARWARAAGREEELRRELAAEVRAVIEERAATLDGPHDVLVDDDVSAPSSLADIAVLRH